MKPEEPMVEFPGQFKGLRATGQVLNVHGQKKMGVSAAPK